jgi:hypothetical protein
VNVPDAGNVVESIDRKTGVVAKWPLKNLRGNYAMALDEESHRVFTITRKTPILVVLNTQTGAEVARLRAAGECNIYSSTHHESASTTLAARVSSAYSNKRIPTTTLLSKTCHGRSESARASGLRSAIDSMSVFPRRETSQPKFGLTRRSTKAQR